MKHSLIILSGPGGCGKDAIIARLLENADLRLQKLVNHTSRAPRPGEQNGVDYFFLTHDEYEDEIKQGNMLEYEVMDSNGEYYGTHKAQLEQELSLGNVICKKMPRGTLKLKEHFGEQAITIFVDADDHELERRLRESNRAHEHETITERMEQARDERQLKHQFDLAIMNHDGELDQVVAKLTLFILSKINR